LRKGGRRNMGHKKSCRHQYLKGKKMLYQCSRKRGFGVDTPERGGESALCGTTHLKRGNISGGGKKKEPQVFRSTNTRSKGPCLAKGPSLVKGGKEGGDLAQGGRALGL